ncbi:MAG: hypothetical protein JW727_01470 [Candidatus Aenigmarchaeota archaeon]|nr:hypothetical protein [Candidatus Aenigmarchaeota archaeon]
MQRGYLEKIGNALGNAEKYVSETIFSRLGKGSSKYAPFSGEHNLGQKSQSRENLSGGREKPVSGSKYCPNPLAERFFSRWPELPILYTAGVKTEGSFPDDSMGISKELCRYFKEASEGKDFELHEIFFDVGNLWKNTQTYAQLIAPGKARSERDAESAFEGENGEAVYGRSAKNLRKVNAGGIPDAYSMINQHPGSEFDYPYRLSDMLTAREKAPPGIKPHKHYFFNYPEAAMEKVGDITGLTWQNMLNKDPLGKPLKEPIFEGPFQWSVLEYDPETKETRVFYECGKVPAYDVDLPDAILIYAGCGTNASNPKVDAITVVGSRKGSSEGGEWIITRNKEKLKGVENYEKVLAEIDNIVDTAPPSSIGVELVVQDTLYNNKLKRLDKVLAYEYVYPKDEVAALFM